MIERKNAPHKEFIGLARVLYEGLEIQKDKKDDLKRADAEKRERDYAKVRLQEANDDWGKIDPKDLSSDAINRGYGIARGYGEESAKLLRKAPEDIVDGVPDADLKKIAGTEEMVKLAKGRDKEDMLGKYQVWRLLEDADKDFDALDSKQREQVVKMIAVHKGEQDAKKAFDGASESVRAAYEGAGQLAVLEGAVNIHTYFENNKREIIGKAEKAYGEAAKKAGSVIDYAREKLVELAKGNNWETARQLIYLADAGKLD